MCKYSCEDAEIVFYSDGQHAIASSTPGTSILQDLTQYSQESSMFFNGTKPADPFCYAFADTHLREKIYVDNIIIVTNESLISQSSDQGVRGFMKKYRSLVNPHLVMISPLLYPPLSPSLLSVCWFSSS
jgi:hypothetical protein